MTHDHEQSLWAASTLKVENGNLSYKLYCCRVSAPNGAVVYGYIKDYVSQLAIPLHETEPSEKLNPWDDTSAPELRKILARYNSGVFKNESDIVKMYRMLGTAFYNQGHDGVVTSSSSSHSHTGFSAELSVYMEDYRDRTPDQIALEVGKRLGWKIEPASIATIRALKS